jgi:thiamine-phosphate pyrophosphorylase
MQPEILRIIDANINRVSEGLRFIEDITRFMIEDPDTTQQIKSIRHRLNEAVKNMDPHLIKSRNSEEDVGANNDIKLEHTDLVSLIRANSKRAQEGLRVLEELSKLREFSILSTEELKKARYEVYSVEKIILAEIPQNIERGL